MPKSLFLVVLLITTISVVQAQEAPLAVLVVQLPKAGISAVRFRDAGKPKSLLIDILPLKGTQMTRTDRELHQIADDVYDFPWVWKLAYFAYMQRRLEREIDGEAAPQKFSQVANEVDICQRAFDEQQQQKLIQCVVRAVNAFKVTPSR